MAKVLNIRGVDEGDARQLSAGAAIRGWTQSKYLKELLALHQQVVQIQGWMWDGPVEHLPRDEEEWDLTHWHVPGVPADEIVCKLGKFMFRHRLYGIRA